MDKMMHYVMRLSLSGFIFGERQKSATAAEILRTWFLRSETKMQPNLKFGQGIPGIVQGRGSASMDMYFSGRGFIDAVQLLELTPNITNIWTYSDRIEFKKWASQFTYYMYNDEGMQTEKKARNNHGVYYDLNVLSWAEFAGESDIIKTINGTSDCFSSQKQVYNCLQGRFADQVNEEGVLIHEIERVDSSHYVWYTLLANAYLATVGAKMDNFAGFTDPFLLRASEWALSYVIADTGSKVEGNHIYAAHAYRMMSRGTGKERYEQVVCDVLTGLSKKAINEVWGLSKVGTHVLNIVMPSIHNSVDMECTVWNKMKALHESKDFLRAAKRSENRFAPRDKIGAEAFENRNGYSLESNESDRIDGGNPFGSISILPIILGCIFVILAAIKTKTINRKNY